jgi:hypothetical protein
MDQWVEAFVKETGLIPEPIDRWVMWHLTKAGGKNAWGQGIDQLAKPIKKPKKVKHLCEACSSNSSINDQWAAIDQAKRWLKLIKSLWRPVSRR